MSTPEHEMLPTRVELRNEHVLFFYTYEATQPYALWWIQDPNGHNVRELGSTRVDLDKVHDVTSQVLDAATTRCRARANELRTEANALDSLFSNTGEA
jgi:hypothetical protein